MDLRHTLPAPAAGSKPRVMTLDKALSPEDIGFLAILNAPELHTERGELALAQADVTQNAMIPNPSASLSYAELLSGPGIAGAYTASLAQDVASLITYRKRVAAARDHVSQVNADLLWKEWQVAQKARLLAVGLYWNNRALKANMAELASLTQAESEAVHALQRGDVSLTATSPLQASRTTLEQSVATLRMQQMKDWASLDDLLGLKPGVRFTISTPAPRLPADLTPLMENVQDRRPDLVALQLGYQSADESVRAAILGQFPALLLGGSWNSDTSKVTSGGPTVTFDLPIFSRNQGAVAHANATRLLLRERYQGRLDATASTLLALRAQRREIASQLLAAEDAVQAADKQASLAQAAYGHNDLDARTLIDFRSAALGRRLQVFDLNRARDQTDIALALELGLGLPQVRIAPLDEVKPQ